MPDAIAQRWRFFQDSLANGRAPSGASTSMTLQRAAGERLLVRFLPLDSGRYILLLREDAEREDPAMLARRLVLSPREAEVLLWIARGKTSAEAAAILLLSRRTVDKHLERIYAKLGVESRVAAAAVAWDAMRASSAAEPRAER